MYDSYYVIIRSDSKISDLDPSNNYSFTAQIPNHFTKRFPNTGNCIIELCNVLLHRDASGTLTNGYIDRKFFSYTSGYNSRHTLYSYLPKKGFDTAGILGNTSKLAVALRSSGGAQALLPGIRVFP